MIIAKLMGGLGNQMFQYATAAGLAEKHNTNVVIDNSWFETTTNVETPRHYELNRFALDQNFIDLGQFALVDKLSTSPKTKLYNLIIGRATPRIFVYKEKGHGFDINVLNLPDNTLLEGYWQTEKYFTFCRYKILHDFTFIKGSTKKNQEVLDLIKRTTSVSLHIRRGDYANNEITKAFRGLTGLGYYQEAANKISRKIKNPHFFIFSDEPEWCRQNLKLSFPSTYVSHNVDGSEDMRLMIHCQHHIIANSTFSWWGAWLNPRKDKIVYAPKQWFNDSSMDTKDVLPKNWIKI